MISALDENPELDKSIRSDHSTRTSFDSANDSHRFMLASLQEVSLRQLNKKYQSDTSSSMGTGNGTQSGASGQSSSEQNLSLSEFTDDATVRQNSLNIHNWLRRSTKDWQREKQGVVYKQCPTFSLLWQSRFFVLNKNGEIFYYKNVSSLLEPVHVFLSYVSLGHKDLQY